MNNPVGPYIESTHWFTVHIKPSTQLLSTETTPIPLRLGFRDVSEVMVSVAELVECPADLSLPLESPCKENSPVFGEKKIIPTHC